MMRERIKMLCREKGVTLAQVENALGFARGYLSKLGNTTPNGAKLHLLAEYFGVSVEFLMTGEDQRTPYYLDDDARELAQFLYENPDYKVLFDVSRKVKREDIDFIRQLIDRANK